MFAHNLNRPNLMARTTALLAILMVLVLTVLAASPDLHERIHSQAANPSQPATHHPAKTGAIDDDDGCVVTLFAQGIVAALMLLALACFGQRLRLPRLVSAEQELPDTPSYLFLPTQAPPGR